MRRTRVITAERREAMLRASERARMVAASYERDLATAVCAAACRWLAGHYWRFRVQP